jgi:sortase A
MKLASGTASADPNRIGATQRPPVSSNPRPYKLRTSTTRRAISLAFLIVGACLLGYVGARYFDMYRTQHNLEAEWQREASAVDRLGRPMVAPVAVLTRLQIPRIKLDAIVLEGATSAQLGRGPGHLEETATPGETGNAVITAHRDTFFRHLFELNQGDEIIVRRGAESLRFHVIGKKVVEPDDLSVLQPTPDAQLTLITCYPTYYIGPAPQRLVVFSKLVE